MVGILILPWGLANPTPIPYIGSNGGQTVPPQPTSKMATYTLTTATCGKCDGKGVLSYYGHIANGVCFDCQGTGKISWKDRTDGTVKTSLEVFIRNGEYWYAAHRATVLADDGTWGKCLTCNDLQDADAARALWKDLKGQQHTYLAVTDIPLNGSEVTKVHQNW